VNKYNQLTLKERYQIKAFLEINLSHSEIARRLSRNKSNISREIKRNRGPGKYDPEAAQRRYEDKKKNSIKCKRVTFEMKEIIKEKIELDWSPEQIVGHCKKIGIKMVSFKTIYTYIKKDRENGGTLYKHLRHTKKRRKKYGSKEIRGQLRNRVSIEESPECANNRKRLGDWEADLIIGKNHKGVIVTLVERLTGVLIMDYVESKNANKVADKIISLLAPFTPYVQTITFDNGKEFARHEKIAKDLKAKMYFAHPYSSWERGTNENTNGLVRQYFPKKSNFEKISEKGIAKVISRLNLRPRKRLGFASPAEAFAERCSRW